MAPSWKGAKSQMCKVRRNLMFYLQKCFLIECNRKIFGFHRECAKLHNILYAKDIFEGNPFENLETSIWKWHLALFCQLLKILICTDNLSFVSCSLEFNKTWAWHFRELHKILNYIDDLSFVFCSLKCIKNGPGNFKKSLKLFICKFSGHLWRKQTLFYV